MHYECYRNTIIVCSRLCRLSLGLRERAREIESEVKRYLPWIFFYFAVHRIILVECFYDRVMRAVRCERVAYRCHSYAPYKTNVPNAFLDAITILFTLVGSFVIFIFLAVFPARNAYLMLFVAHTRHTTSNRKKIVQKIRTVNVKRRKRTACVMCVCVLCMCR